MKHVLAYTLACLMFVGVASAGQVSPGLDALMTTMKGGDEITVLVVLKDRVDVASLDWELRTSKAPLSVRHETVVSTLRDKAAHTQAGLISDLEAEKAAGSVLGYTPHWLVNAVVVRTTVDDVPRLAARDDVDVVEADLQIELIGPVGEPRSKGPAAKGVGTAPGVEDVGARRVWEELGIDGTGALVGVLDTGVQGDHEALSARWRGNFADTDECWLDAAGLGDTTPIDQHYHGTHVMGTITGLAEDDTIGVAPGAQWIATNVINMSSGTAFDNAVIASLEFMADPDGDSSTTDDVPDVVQNSWGVNEDFTGYYDCDSRWWDAIDACEAAGVVLTWSAGNEGEDGTSTMRSPADRATSIYNTFSVGSTNHTSPYTVSDFSSRGPSGCGGDYAMKPEIMAPGDDIYSADPDGGYQYLSGTSMAGPHIAGVVALMRAANPDLDVETVKQILMDTAIDLGDTGEDNDYGYGFVDGYSAVLACMTGFGTLDGTVTDLSTGLPVEGATVVISATGETTRTRTTDATGYFSTMLPAGDWAIDVTAFGYVGQTASAVTVTEDLTTTQDFQLVAAPSALLSGYVYDDEAAPIDGATITVLDTPLSPVTSGSDGYYEITIPTGSVYDVLASSYGMGSQQVSLDFQSAMTQDFTLPQLIFENFESGTLVVYDWQTSGDVDWAIATDETYEGAYSVKSGGITHGGSSVLEITLDVLAGGNLEFYYKVSSEEDYDYLTFSIDGTSQDAWSGEVDWALASFPVDAGSHTFTWSYDKDGSLSSGDDCAWVDYVVFPTIAEPTYPDMAASPTSLTEWLQPGDTSTQYITLDNTGDGDLTYVVTVDLNTSTSTASVPSEPVIVPKDAPDTRVGESPLLGSGGPDDADYTWIDSNEYGGPTFDWVDITAIGTSVSLADDAYSSALSLGFDFTFYGNIFDTVKICSNGFLSFTSTTTGYSNQSIPNSSEPNNVLAGFWDDFDPTDGGSIYYYADTANSRFIVEYYQIPHYSYSGTGLYTYQIILNADGSILYQYLDMQDDVDSATIGIENADGDIGLEVVYNAAYMENELAILFSFVPPPDPWLVVTPSSGTISGQTTGTQLDVNFDATELEEGTYSGTVTIGGNDPDNPQVAIPVTLVVSTGTAAEDLPSTFALGSAYPNPFNPSTKIAFSVPAGGGHVDLSIYDLSGRLVRTLVSGEYPGGEHTTVWTGDDGQGRRVASGTYFYRLRASGFEDTRKMVLVK